MCSGVDNWIEDRLGRKQLADHLTQSLQALVKSSGSGLTVALDADWGAGKSFFIKCWSKDLRQQGYSVVCFDAWENDLCDEPSVSLMAAIADELVGSSFVSNAKETTISTIRSFSKVMISPVAINVAKIVGKGILKKSIGVNAEDIEGAISNGISLASEGVDGAVDDVVDSLSSEILELVERRKSQVRDFKKKLQYLAGASAPGKCCFVLIDELDRCRPPYALKLLEEVKHIFSVHNVVFVFSTNLGQLRHLVSKEYGENIDSKRYLNRFFDREYRLPKPKLGSGIASWPELQGIEQRWKGRVVSGVPEGHGVGAWAFWQQISLSVLGSDMRAHKRALRLLDEVIDVVIGKFDQCHFAWLSYLCVLYYVDLDFLEEMQSPHYLFSAGSADIASKFRGGDGEIKFNKFIDDKSPFSRTVGAVARVSEVIHVYYRASGFRGMRDIVSVSSYSYPDSLISDDLGNISNYLNRWGRSQFIDYVSIVYRAGLLLPDQD